MSEWVTTLSLVVLETAVLVWRPLETDFFAVLVLVSSRFRLSRHVVTRSAH